MGKYKVIQVGCGKMSTYTMKYALDKGYEIVGALDISSELIGKDIGNVLGSEDTGVVIEDIAVQTGCSLQEAEKILRDFDKNIL